MKMTSCLSLLVMVAVVVMQATVKGETVNLDFKEQQSRRLDAEEACRKIMENQPYPTSGLYCNRTWDTIMCWPDTPAGTTASQSCASYINLFDTTKKARRVCLPTGQWFVNDRTNATWTNFTDCIGEPTPTNDVPEIAEGMRPSQFSAPRGSVFHRSWGQQRPSSYTSKQRPATERGKTRGSIQISWDLEGVNVEVNGQGPRTGGHNSPWSGGRNSPRTGGYNSPRTGGYNSPWTGGRNSPRTGGYNSPRTGGRNWPRTGGYNSPTWT